MPNSLPNQKGFSHILVGLIVLLALIFSAYFYLLNSKKKMVSDNVNPNPQPQTTLYTNSILGFNINLPSGWNLEKEGDEYVFRKGSESDNIIMISETLQNNETLIEFISEKLLKYPKSVRDNIVTTKIKVYNLDAYLVQNEPNTQDSFYIKKGDKVLRWFNNTTEEEFNAFLQGFEIAENRGF